MFSGSFKTKFNLVVQISAVLNSVFCKTDEKLTERSRMLRLAELNIVNPSSSQDFWVPVESYGLMLSHYPVRSNYVNGQPVVLRDGFDEHDNDHGEDSVFSPSLSSLTSNYRDFVKIDEKLLQDLTERSWLHDPINPNGRDIVKRDSGAVTLSKRSDGSKVFKLSLGNTKKTGGKSSILSKSSSPKRLIIKRKSSSGKKDDKGVKSTVSKTSVKVKTLKNFVKSATIITKWTPTDSSLVIAVTQQWSGRPNCGDFFEISVTGKSQPLQLGSSVIARVVDLCGGCKPEVPHADLSKAAFIKLFDLDIGIVSGLQMKKVSPPENWDENLYGPRVL
ncbi:secreted protein [Phakopsora pachyrhizi]|uniref:Secreted protein n=1 Tax=Phakopsora pachyrhizi TaxID=170000 RepID=A0AAV0BUN9_PHAPC|nr:secreted protein [Phakopsora pachyrhizi]